MVFTSTYCGLNFKALVGAFNQVKALVGAFSVITNLCVDLRLNLYGTPLKEWQIDSN